MATLGSLGMRRMSAKEAKNGFGRLIDYALAEAVQIEKHGRPVVVVVSTEEYARLCKSDNNEQRTSVEALRLG